MSWRPRLFMVVRPWLDSNFPDGYVFQQNSTYNKSNKIQEWCQKNLAGFWPWTMWPRSSPDLNPFGYEIWDTLESKACKTCHTNKDSLKAAIEEERAAMSNDFVINTLML